jgi:hypothetical protein
VTAQAEFTIGEVAAMIGFSRRHQILEPHRTPSMRGSGP